MQTIEIIQILKVKVSKLQMQCSEIIHKNKPNLNKHQKLVEATLRSKLHLMV
jgi:hypothetical protein